MIAYITNYARYKDDAKMQRCKWRRWKLCTCIIILVFVASPGLYLFVYIVCKYTRINNNRVLLLLLLLLFLVYATYTSDQTNQLTN